MNYVTYNSYLAYTDARKISLFDDGVPVTLFKSEKTKRKFLQDVIEQDANHYLRKKALENISSMCILGESLNNSTALSVLLDLEDNDEPFVLCTKIKYLFFLNEKLELNDVSIIDQIETLRYHENGDVSSTAEYYMGMHHVLMANTCADQMVFHEKISEAGDFFKRSASISENRLDAELLLEICNLINLSILNKDNSRRQCLVKLNILLADRHSSYIYSTMPDFELWLYKIVFRISKIVCTLVNEWLDIPMCQNTLHL